MIRALRFQAQIGAPPAEIECSAPNDYTVLAYIKFEHEWHVIGFAMPYDCSREQVEQAFISALAFDADGATIH